MLLITHYIVKRPTTNHPQFQDIFDFTPFENSPFPFFYNSKIFVLQAGIIQPYTRTFEVIN